MILRIVIIETDTQEKPVAIHQEKAIEYLCLMLLKRVFQDS